MQNPAFQKKFAAIKRVNKEKLATLSRRSVVSAPATLALDVQIKRLV